MKEIQKYSERITIALLHILRRGISGRGALVGGRITGKKEEKTEVGVTAQKYLHLEKEKHKQKS